MASSAGGPVRATASAIASKGDDGSHGSSGYPAGTASTAAAAAASFEARHRSKSPGTYGGQQHPPRSGQRASSHTGGTSVGSTRDNSTIPSPRTPRQGNNTQPAPAGTIAMEMRISAAVSEVQRQGEADRRGLSRQLHDLEKRVFEELSNPTTARDRWAELQGSVGGVLEEMTALSRRVESLDEKLRTRTSACEEALKQKSRELEQQAHASQHRTQLSLSTSEEVQKRQSAKLRKVGQVQEDQLRRLSALEELVRRPEQGRQDSIKQVELRLQEVEHHQAAFGKELRGFSATLSERASQIPSGVPLSLPTFGGHEGGDHAGSELGGDSPLVAIERELVALKQRVSEQLDDHAATLANLRVRTDGQEQRIIAAVDRHTAAAEKVTLPSLESLRAEMAQLRAHDRREFETRLEHCAKRIQAVLEASEELAVERTDTVRELGSSTVSPTNLEDHHVIRNLRETSTAQEKKLRRLEAASKDARNGSGGGVSHDDFCDALVRVATLEHRADSLESTSFERDLSEKADRSELQRVDAAVRELAEPLRRISQRAAGGEARTTALERRVEQVQQQVETLWQSNASSSTTAAHATELANVAARVDALTREVSAVVARVGEAECLLDDAWRTGDRGGSPEASKLSQ
eukprot:TRINITY_DN26404_c0_g1_i1.p1 TRINITY_DN26404_c0_g1~~TRINITY_DN26404_c0_g1_i1.p1  ORF type:complete len:647 (-),score=144.90 TRINITY_DN26404_c0_g1_i1:82-1989(-)